MQPPCEIMVSRFLPNMRGLVSHELKEKGESQRRIASLLGITQARVSNYLSNSRSTYSDQLSKLFGTSLAEVQSYAKTLSEDARRSQVDGIFTLYSIWRNLLFNGNVCAIHQLESTISPECSVCMELHKPSRDTFHPTDSEAEEIAVLRDISEAISIIENSSTFPLVMPEVSVNIAMSKANPKSGKDIAAIPGRINRLHGRAKAFVLPEFGSSNHLSKVLLMFNARYRKIRAVMNLRDDKLMERALAKLGIVKILSEDEDERATKRRRRGTTIRDSNQTPSIDELVLTRLSHIHLPDALVASSQEDSFFAVIDKGSAGVEPITYLFGAKASQLAEVAMKIAHQYGSLLNRKTG